jgi:hypothetical protein
MNRTARRQSMKGCITNLRVGTEDFFLSTIIPCTSSIFFLLTYDRHQTDGREGVKEGKAHQAWSKRELISQGRTRAPFVQRSLKLHQIRSRRSDRMRTRLIVAHCTRRLHFTFGTTCNTNMQCNKTLIWYSWKLKKVEKGAAWSGVTVSPYDTRSEGLPSPATYSGPAGSELI